MSNTIPGISRFSEGVSLAQHRVEEVLLESLARYSNVKVQRNVEPASITFNPGGGENSNEHPVTVRIAQVETMVWSDPFADSTSNGAVETNGQIKKRKLSIVHHDWAMEDIKAKYLISCDGVHSWTRSQLGIQMEGEQSEYIWGVLGTFLRCVDELQHRKPKDES